MSNDLILKVQDLDPVAIARGQSPGVYTLVRSGTPCAHLTVYEFGKQPEVWGLHVDSMKLVKLFGLPHLGEIDLEA